MQQPPLPERRPGRRRGIRSPRVGALPAVVMALVLAACAGAPDPNPPDRTATATATPRADIAGTFDIGDGRRMYLECRGSGAPTVILISGQRGSAADWSITVNDDEPVPVFAQLAEQTRVCAYDRPGTPVGDSFSRSDPAPQPTTAGAMVDDLRALLRSAGETGPFVLVGHSAGGLAARLYAADHPADVSGLVLVDALSPGLQDAETPEQWTIQLQLLAGDIAESLIEYPDLEQVDVTGSFAQVRAAPPLPALPLSVISADRSLAPVVAELVESGAFPPEVPADFGSVVDAAQAESQAGLARLAPGAEHLTHTNSGHNVHQEQPVLVADAIMRVVDRVREHT